MLPRWVSPRKANDDVKQWQGTSAKDLDWNFMRQSSPNIMITLKLVATIKWISWCISDALVASALTSFFLIDRTEWANVKMSRWQWIGMSRCEGKHWNINTLAFASLWSTSFICFSNVYLSREKNPKENWSEESNVGSNHGSQRAWSQPKTDYKVLSGCHHERLTDLVGASIAPIGEGIGTSERTQHSHCCWCSSCTRPIRCWPNPWRQATRLKTTIHYHVSSVVVHGHIVEIPIIWIVTHYKGESHRTSRWCCPIVGITVVGDIRGQWCRVENTRRTNRWWKTGWHWSRR